MVEGGMVDGGIIDREMVSGEFVWLIDWLVQFFTMMVS